MISYLSPSERQAGLILYKALSVAESLFKKDVSTPRDALLKAATDTVNGEPRVTLQYFSLADPLTLKEVDIVPSHGAILSGAIQVGKTRLIDNFILKPN